MKENSPDQKHLTMLTYPKRPGDEYALFNFCESFKVMIVYFLEKMCMKICVYYITQENFA